MKLSQRYYEPFKVLEHISEVAYKLDLPPSYMLHPVFHITVLKKRVGNSSLIAEVLPSFDEEGRLLLKPKETIRYRSWRQGRGTKEIWQVLVHWSGVPKEEASWEDYDDMVKRFPDFSLEDKDILKERGNDESTKRRSKRVKGQVGA